MLRASSAMLGCLALSLHSLNAADLAVRSGPADDSVVVVANHTHAGVSQGVDVTLASGNTGRASAVWHNRVDLLGFTGSPTAALAGLGVSSQVLSSDISNAATAGVDISLRLPGIPRLSLSGAAGKRDGQDEAAADWQVCVRYLDVDLAFTGTATTSQTADGRRSTVRPGFALDLSPVPGLAPRTLLLGAELLVLRDGPISEMAKSVGFSLHW